MNEKMGNAKYFENDLDMPNNCKSQIISLLKKII
jgi:hypothetical protein